MFIPFKILMVASECVPFAKTGGLADVVGSLPKALKALGHEVRIVMPKYSMIDAKKHGLAPFHKPMGVWMGSREEWCSVDRAFIFDDIPVYFVEFSHYFGREGLYHDRDSSDYADNPRRFAFLSRAALQLCADIDFAPDVAHAHDWQTALAPAYLKVWHWNDRVLGRAAGMLTIHNLAYQGVYHKSHYNYIGLQEGNFVPDKLEDHGKVNFLKGGIAFSDAVNTVSPGYAYETRTPEGGFGLAPYLSDKGERYTGILNGVDYGEWNPAADPLIPAKYSMADLQGKLLCKNELQRRLGLEQRSDIPVVGVISRFAHQKGLDLLAQVIERAAGQMAVQFAILGAGDRNLENYFGVLPAAYKGKIGSYIGYSNELAHLIEAGSDFFLMPSRYEPCGLNQIYSLKYGTLPIVRATGGLNDTVIQYNERSGEGTGFMFWQPTAGAVFDTIGWAVSTWFDRKPHIQAMIQKAMSQHFSWGDSARQYEKAYEKAIKHKRNLT
ncbi:MAG: glycogen synthase GlgA [Candidatus Edwardsbacteria bacterium]|nr:glycogen synthase GlgA [Candidatus Edwardsbacteria bacterium]